MDSYTISSVAKTNGNFKITRNNKNFNLDVQKDVEGSRKEIGTCRRCEMTNIEVHATLTILSLPIFDKDYNKRIHDLKISNVPKSTITINQLDYKLISCIFAHSTTKSISIDYTNVVGLNNQWFKIDGSSVQKVPWPTCSKDVYIFFLERK